MFDGDKLIVLIVNVSLSWKKSFFMRVVIPHKMSNCNKCTIDFISDDCDDLVNQKKEFSANLNDFELEREAPNEGGHILPCYIQFESDEYFLRSVNYEKYSTRKKIYTFSI